MTTAARPTWAPAKGGNEQGGTRIFGPSGKYSSRDLAAHTSLKPRLHQESESGSKWLIMLHMFLSWEKRASKLKRRYRRGISGTNLRSVSASTSHPRISPMLMRGTDEKVRACS
ncbi:unnamed protein product [Triticum turgidum subsp. durum]|uniref:Uncharacterized protein n=1 Tax=Triticum turgidum subsp. durum TaxID=4567 RepID=A0A9R0TY87_TRITD|nr:unnamed protein product [Triticum turgidum subsp. durum]